MRAETGSMQFGNDWRGVFIRGDNAAYYAIIIKLALEHHQELKKDVNTLWALEELLKVLENSNERTHLNEDGVQKMKPFEECVREEGE